MAVRKTPKPLSSNDKPEALGPRAHIALDTLGNVRSEMARLYRLGLRGKVEPDVMTKFTYVLKEIRACIESGALEDVQRRLAELSAKVGGARG